MQKFILSLFPALLLLNSCSQVREEPIKIAINPWPGYEYLYLAHEKGFFDQVGLNIRLVPLSSLSDAQRAYMLGRVDGLTSTLIEVVQSQILSDRPLKIILLTDFSNGGDVIIANSDIKEVADLKGRRIGAELSSLGLYMLHRALETSGLNLDDVELLNIEQSGGATAMQNKTIDAYVTYPPVSIELLATEANHTIFTSAKIPFEIIDTISISDEVLTKNPEVVIKLRKAWDMALKFASENPQIANELMAKRERISTEDFSAALNGISVLRVEEQQEFFQSPEKLQNRAIDVCKILVRVNALDTDCNLLPNIVFK